MSDKLPKSKLAYRSKNAGILSILISWVPIIGWAVIAYAMVSGIVAINDISEGRYSESGRKAARTGLITAAIALVLIPIELILFGLLVYFGVIVVSLS
jgi:membrane protein YqaA with SNARE-associated domain